MTTKNVTNIGDLTKPVLKKYSCFGCGGLVNVHLDKETHRKIINRGNKTIQNIIPNLDISTREFFITGMCPNCQDEMYSNLREFEDED